MMSELTRLHDEALRLLTIYEEHKDSKNEWARRKAHLDLDRFLMEHREIAAILMVQGLHDSFSKPPQERKSAPWYKRMTGGFKRANNQNIQHH